jgi:hypothetical protein
MTVLDLDPKGTEGFRKGSPIERALRDPRAARFHPYDRERTLPLAGRPALGLPCDWPTAWAAS